MVNVEVTFPSDNTWCVTKSVADWVGNVHAVNTGNVGDRGEELCSPLMLAVTLC